MAAEDVIEATDATWEQTVEKSVEPVVVMFYTPTCPHCKTMEPYYFEYAGEFKDIVRFVRLDVASNMWTGERYGVRGTPTFKFFCQGRPVRELVGAAYPALIKKVIEETLVYGEDCIRNSTVIDYEITGYG